MSETKMATKADLKEMYDRMLPYLGGSADAGFTPVGTVISVMSNHAPANYLVCDGTVYNIADYPELANHFLNEFGSKNYFGGDGTTTFGLPTKSGSSADEIFCIATKNIYLNPSLDYSTDEKVVGTWIDGKPLYQKTFTNIEIGNVVTDGTSVSYSIPLSDIGIENVDFIMLPECYLFNNSGLCVPCLSCINSADTFDRQLRVFVSKTNLSSYNSNTLYNGRTLTGTLRYTKNY